MPLLRQPESEKEFRSRNRLAVAVGMPTHRPAECPGNFSDDLPDALPCGPANRRTIPLLTHHQAAGGRRLSAAEQGEVTRQSPDFMAAVRTAWTIIMGR